MKADVSVTLGIPIGPKKLVEGKNYDFAEKYGALFDCWRRRWSIPFGAPKRGFPTAIGGTNAKAQKRMNNEEKMDGMFGRGVIRVTLSYDNVVQVADADLEQYFQDLKSRSSQSYDLPTYFLLDRELSYEQYFVVNDICFGGFWAISTTVIPKRLGIWLLENYDDCAGFLKLLILMIL
ncbi:hypothetical protein Cgig2_010430 [Carnegiea gigantea]|uniref:Uncharacterized protein n=1 Tax=Carnegiea gigantea TaxID=171969 RepID=A0A9Q1GLT3_9CARY|nr:hypothetical protein Cgig2_010430 [Carnegiea gigantea]